jgi:CHAT domain-containing protein
MNPDQKLAENNKPEAPVKWAELVRKFLSQRNSKFLRKAIFEAKKLGEFEIINCLESVSDSNTDDIKRLTDKVIPILDKFGRDEEALTLKLLYLDTLAALTETYLEFPIEDQKEIRELGIRACRLAVETSLILRDKPCYAFFESVLADGFYSSNQFREAKFSYEKALKLYRQLAGEEPQTFRKDVAITLRNLGALQRRVKNPAKAESFLQEALKIYRRLAIQKPSVFKQDVAITLNDLGMLQSDLRQLAEAESFFFEALQIFRELAGKEPRIFNQDLASILNNLGLVQTELRKFAAAENSSLEALKIFQSLAKKEPQSFNRDVAGTLNNLSNLQTDLRKFAEAENSLLEALKIYRELAKEEPSIFNHNLALTLNNLGSTRCVMRKFAQAESCFTEALRIRRKLAKRQPQVFNRDVAMTLNNSAYLKFELSSFAEAEVFSLEALNIYRELTGRQPHVFGQDTALALNNLGTIQIALKNFAGAETSFREALEIYQQLAEAEPQIFNQDIVMTLNNLGYLQFANENFDEAENFFNEARSLADNLREKEIDIVERNRVMQENVNVYNGLLECRIKKQDLPGVLQIAELGKSRSLSDLLNLKSADLKPKAPTSNSTKVVEKLGKQYADAVRHLQQLNNSENYLSEQINQLNQDLRQIESDDFIDAATRETQIQEINSAKKSLDLKKQKALQKRLQMQSQLQAVMLKIKKYDNNFPPKVPVINNEEIIKIAESLNRTIVIFRVLLQSTAIIFVFPNGSLHIETVSNFGQNVLFKLSYDDWLIPYQEWKKNHRMFALREASWQAKSPESGIKDWLLVMESTLETIYKKLMFYVHQVLKEKSPTKEILFIPSQSLAVLPLHAARWKDENGEYRYLLEEFTISYCPSVSVFKRCRENEKIRTNKTLFITNPTTDLVFSEKEVKFIKKIHQSNTDLRRKKARKSAVMKALENDYGFTHFACHGFYYLENQFDSGLVMAADEVIKLSEIINCNLPNNWLTTLSACETGMVDFASPTDEHFGLPLGFIFAGSPSVWASLWSVSDETTSRLMQKAYENLSKKEFYSNKPESLRQAQLSILREFSHPYYWAGFQHYGI